MSEQQQEDRLTNPEPETTSPFLSSQQRRGRGPETTETETLRTTHAQGTDPMLVALFARSQRMEDRFFLAGFLTLVFALILWAIAEAYPAVGTALNVLVSSGVIVLTCAILIPCMELSWEWMRKADAKDTAPADASAYGWVAIGMWALICVLIGCLIATILSAGQPSVARTALIIIELVFLAIQCWRVVRRYTGN